MHVVDPCNFEIYYGARQSPSCGGKLDIDMNAGSNTNSVNPIENIFFTTVKPGTYTIIIDLFAIRGFSSSSFRVVVLRADGSTQVFTGTVSSTVRNQTFKYTV